MKKIALLLVSLCICLIAFANVYPYTFQDDSGNTITVRQPFKRILSLYGAHTENFYYMGAQDLLIGISDNEAFPPSFRNKPSFSYKDDPEKFIQADPDLVILRPMIVQRYPKLIEKLQKYGITVVSLQPENYSDIFNYWEVLGVLCGKIQESKDMKDSFLNQLNMFKELDKSAYTTVFFESVHKNFKTTTNGSIADFVLKRSGLDNIAQSAQQVREGSTIAEFSKEQLIDNGDKIEFYIAQVGVMNKITVQAIKKEPGIAAVKAVREDNIILVDEKIISRPTPRIIYAIMDFYKIMHNDLFMSEYELYNDAPLTNLSFSRIIIDCLKIPFTTPEYFTEEKEKNGHLFGQFKDIVYVSTAHIYAETAFYNDIVNTSADRFEPDKKVSSQSIADTLKKLTGKTLEKTLSTNRELLDYLRK
ncbi:MAG TPA: ABC transporter substrate-binding protein [Petrotogaceae bacterium]|nr:ABC transporter substrate-binding protein [Petrotogaceae bacterium]